MNGWILQHDNLFTDFQHISFRKETCHSASQPSTDKVQQTFIEVERNTTIIKRIMRDISRISQQAISKQSLLPAEFSAWGWFSQIPKLKSVYFCISIIPITALVHINCTWDTRMLYI